MSSGATAAFGDTLIFALGLESVQDGQCEGRRLARACLGATDQVTTFEDTWNGLGLDGGRGFVTFGLDSAKERLGEAEIFKLHQ